MAPQTEQDERGQQRRRLAVAIYASLYNSANPEGDGERRLRSSDPVGFVLNAGTQLQGRDPTLNGGNRITRDEAGTIFGRTMKPWVVADKDNGGYKLVKPPQELMGEKPQKGRPSKPPQAQTPPKKADKKRGKSNRNSEPSIATLRQVTYERARVEPVSDRPPEGRIEHGWLGAYMLASEEEVWHRLIGQVPSQPTDGWNPSWSPILYFDAIRTWFERERNDILEVIGRLCAAGVLKRDTSNGLAWRIVHNPRNVKIQKLERRWIVSASSELLTEIKNTREHAKALRAPHGLVNLDRLLRALGARTEAQEDEVYRRFIMCDAREAQWDAFGVLMECDGDACYWVPSSLSGRDFFAHRGRDRTELVEEPHAQYTGCVTALRDQFIKIARES